MPKTHPPELQGHVSELCHADTARGGAARAQSGWNKRWRGKRWPHFARRTSIASPSWVRQSDLAPPRRGQCNPPRPPGMRPCDHSAGTRRHSAKSSTRSSSSPFTCAAPASSITTSAATTAACARLSAPPGARSPRYKRSANPSPRRTPWQPKRDIPLSVWAPVPKSPSIRADRARSAILA